MIKFDDDFEEEYSEYPELEPFFNEGFIEEVLYQVKSGKEATVYCCRVGPGLNYEAGLVAAKVYRSRNNRNFKNDAIYQEGRMRQEVRPRRAVQKKTGFGRAVQAGMWVGHEFETMRVLHKAGADIPCPLKQTEGALLMEFLGDGSQAAPLLNFAEFDRENTEIIFNQILKNIRLWLSLNIVHGDLSAYNILYWEGVIKIIDFPQAIDPRFNSNAQTLLTRDITNISRFFNRFGLIKDPGKISRELWGLFQRSQL